MEAELLQARLARHTPEPMGTTGHYAVLVPLTVKDGQTHLIYEVRAASLHRQPGEVCFPGGHMEPGEDAVRCALRETREELGIPRGKIAVLGEMDFLVNRDRSVLYPVPALIEPEAADAMTLQAGEVERTLLVPLSGLRAAPPVTYEYELAPRLPDDFPYELLNISRDYPWMTGKRQGLVYRWQGHAIWGMTGMITRQLLALTQEDAP